MVPPKVAMRTSPVPLSASGMDVTSGHAACALAGRMNGAARPPPKSPKAVRRPNGVFKRCLRMTACLRARGGSVRQKIVAELRVLVALAHQAAVLEGGDQPVLDLRQGATVDVGHGEQEAVAAHLLHHLTH